MVAFRIYRTSRSPGVASPKITQFVSDVPASFLLCTFAPAQMTDTPRPQPRPVRVKAIHAFETEVSTELALKPGDIIEVMDIGDESGWIWGKNILTGELGWFPLTFTEDIDVEAGRESQ
ncbi:hypothetical protein EJ04DRAFT_567896 [Polyplosphaeria fusca]|uniref:SH3 domain-containing protein n=1 Tax=Polyplosphaeria fusca TaxID=682080 RepID=A0A9P4QPQ8_9PLEO|nr:hypothetical protein EJ04DRAFT_567896 [Polyplosphaeria fusca]